MITEVTAVNFRQNLGEMLNQVQYRNDSILVSKDGKPVAALVDAELFARIRRMRERFDALSARIAHGYATVPEAEGLAERRPMAEDARKHAIHLTEAARIEPLLSFRAEVEAALLDGIPAEDIATTRRVLAKMASRVESLKQK